MASDGCRVGRALIVFWCTVGAVASAAGGEAIDYPKFGTTAGLALVGSAAQSGDRMRLTSAAEDKIGAAWFTEKQPVQDGFVSTFQFQITTAGGCKDADGKTGADGFAFLVQNASLSALSTPSGLGMGIGYYAIPNSVAVEFDTYLNRDWGDPNGNHVSVHTRGWMGNSSSHTYSLGSTTAVPDLSDGRIHTARIQYRPGTLDIYIDNLTTPVLTVALNLASTLNLDDGKAWLGFTAATWAAWENHDILSWYFRSGQDRLLCKGDLVVVTDTGASGLTLRQQPSTSTQAVGFMPDGWILKIGQSEPVLADGHTWWAVSEASYEPAPKSGWVAEPYLKQVSGKSLSPASDPSMVTANQAKVEAAITWALQQTGKKDWRNGCLAFVAQAFGLKHAGYENPNKMKESLGDSFHAVGKGWNPPRGALLFFSARGGEKTPHGYVDYGLCGHIGIYLGEGEMVHAFGKVQRVPIAGKDGVLLRPCIESYIGWAWPPSAWLEQRLASASPPTTAPVTLTLYVHDGSAARLVLPGSQVMGKTGAGRRSTR